MKEFSILMYEDSDAWKKSFEFALEPFLSKENIKLVLHHRLNGDTIMQDIELLPKLILIDYDLGDSTGEEIIAQISDDPQFQKVSIILYSGGESVESLREIASRYQCKVACYTKQGDDLLKTVVNKGIAS